MYDPFSSEHRRLTGKLVRRVLRNLWRTADDAPAQFVRETLVNSFKVPSVTLGPLHMFPEQQVFALLKSVIEGPGAKACVSYLLALIGETYAEEGSFDSKMSFLGWCFVLLSNALECESSAQTDKALVMHRNCICSACGSTPILGTRYKCVNLADCDLCEDCEADINAYPDPSHVFLKVPKPMAFPSSADPPTQRVVGALLPELKTLAKHPFHEGVACDRCGIESIGGTRYKCVNCDEFNLCEKCEQQQHEHFDGHVFVKLRRPLPQNASKNPSALVPDQNVIPLLLDSSAAPFSSNAK